MSPPLPVHMPASCIATFLWHKSQEKWHLVTPVESVNVWIRWTSISFYEWNARWGANYDEHNI